MCKTPFFVNMLLKTPDLFTTEKKNCLKKDFMSNIYKNDFSAKKTGPST